MAQIDVLIPHRLNGEKIFPVVRGVARDCNATFPDHVTIDFSRLGYVLPSGITFLSNFIHWLRGLGATVNFTGYNRDVDCIHFLDDSLFFQQFLGKKLRNWASPRETTRPLVQARHEQSQSEVRDHFIPWLMTRLNMSRNSLYEVQNNILEIFNNIQDHSSLDIGCLFAQHFPKLNRVSVAIADFGIGIPATVRKVSPNLSDNAAIILAAQRGFTSGRQPRNKGEGLSILMDTVVVQNQGAVTIYSQGGAVTFRADRGRIIPQPWRVHGFCPGTTIEIWLRTDTLPCFPDEEDEVLEW